MSTFVSLFLYVIGSLFSPRIELCEEERVVVPVHDLLLPDTDTTVTGTVTMLSDKMQALDVVTIKGRVASRRVRILLDAEISPYAGGIITARIKPTEFGFSGYMAKARLLDWSEETVDRSAVSACVDRLLDSQARRLERLLAEIGFNEFSPGADLVLEGYAINRKLLIWSMRGEGVLEGILETYPVLVFWSTPGGRLKRVFLTVRGQVFEAE